MPKDKLHDKMQIASITATDVILDGAEAADVLKIIDTGIDMLESVGKPTHKDKLKIHVEALSEFKERYT